MAGKLIDELRSTFGSELSDDELLVKASDALGVSMGSIAQEAGIRTSGKWGNRASAGLDSAQAQLADTANAAAKGLGWDRVADWADQTRVRNEGAANAQRRIAAEQGAVMDWRDVRGIGSGAEFVGGLALDTLPQMGATIAGGLAGGAIGGAIAGPPGAVVGGMAGAGLSGAPFNYGDIRGNMREQSGTTDDLAALALTVPYTALDTFGGIGGKVARLGGKVFGREVAEQAGKDLLETGGKSAARRYGTAVAKDTLAEGAGETGQEVVNQLGRMAVDPNASLTSDDAMQRYLDSFVGGAVLGGAVGAVTNIGAGRSRPADRPSIDEQGGTQLVGRYGMGESQAGPPLPERAGLTPEMLGAPTPPNLAPSAAPNAAPAAPPTPEEIAKQKQGDADKALIESIKTTRGRLDIADDGTSATGAKVKAGQVLKLGKTLRDLDTMLEQDMIDEDQHRMGIAMLKQGLESEVKNEIKQWELADAEAKKATAKAKQPAGGAQTAAAGVTTTQPVAAPAAAVAAPAAPAVAAPAAAPVAPAPPAPAAPVASAPVAAAPVQTAETAETAEAPAPAPTPAPTAAPVAPPTEPVVTVKDGVKHTVYPPAPAPKKSAPIETRAATAEATEGVLTRAERAGKSVGHAFVTGMEKLSGKTASEDERQAIYAVAGFDENGEQIGDPITLKQAAERMTKRGFHGDVSESGISKRLSRFVVDGKKLGVKQLHQLARRASALRVEEGTAAKAEDAKPGQEAAEHERESVATTAQLTEDEEAAKGDVEFAQTHAASADKGKTDGETETEDETQTEVDDQGENIGMTIGEEGRENVSNITNDELASTALTKMLASLSEHTASPLNTEQRAAVAGLLKTYRAMKAGKAEGKATLKGLRKSVHDLIANKELFPDRDVAASVQGLVKITETRALKAAKAAEAARAEEDARNALEAKLAEQNAAQQALNKAKEESNAALRQQWRDQMAMSAEARTEALHEHLGQKTELINDIPDSQEWWDENSEETELKFADLDPDLQAVFVRYFGNFHATAPAARAGQKLNLYRKQEEVMQDAQQRGITRNRYGQDQTAPARIPGEGLPAAGVTAETAGGVGQEVAPAPAAVQGAEGGNAPAGLQEVAGRDATGPAAENDLAEAAGQRGFGDVGENPFPESTVQEPVFHGTQQDFDVGDMRGGDIGVHFGSMYQAADRGGLAPENYVYGRATTGTPSHEVQERLGEVLQPTGGMSTVAKSQLGRRRMIKAFINLRNPLRMREPEGGAWHDPARLRDALAQAGVTLPERLNNFVTGFSQSASHVSTTRDRMLDGQKVGLDKITAHLKTLGYDGVVYPNNFEGKSFARLFGDMQRGQNIVGRDSYIVFDASQISTPSYDVLYNLERNRLTADPPAGLQTGTGRPRAPGLVRTVRRGERLLTDGTITADQFAEQTSAALAAADAAAADRAQAARQRGALLIRERLLAGQRRGELNAAQVEFADWLLRQNPQWATDLGLSTVQRTRQTQGTAGFYDPVDRIITLIKGSDSSDTAVHEVLHHTERMMPPAIQNAIRREWSRQLARAHRKAMRGDNAYLAAYYSALMDHHFGSGAEQSRLLALNLLRNGRVPYEVYQHFNASEFWAINGTGIMEGRFGVSESVLGRMRQWLAEFVERIKGAFGLNSNTAILNALTSLAQSDGRYQTGTMVSHEPGLHFMYAGINAQNQEANAQYNTFLEQHMMGVDPAATRLATGWWVGQDGKSRHEFSDENARWKEDPLLARTYSATATPAEQASTSYALSDVLGHPELYKNYPDAANVVVRFVNEPDSSVYGSYHNNVITINKATKGATPESILGTLVHETQHWVQDKEGFSPGGNQQGIVFGLPDDVFEAQRAPALDWLASRALPAAENADLFDAVLAHPDVQQAFDLNAQVMESYKAGLPSAERVALRKQFNELATRILTEANGGEMPSSGLGAARDHFMQMLAGEKGFRDRGEQARKEATQLRRMASEVKSGSRADAQRGVNMYLQATPAGYELYRALHGETEARDTQNRMRMTAEERRASMPLEATVRADLAQTAQEKPYLPVHMLTGKQLAASSEPGFQNIERITKGFPAASKATATAAQHLGVRLGKGDVAPWLQATRFTRDILNGMMRNAESALGKAAKAYGEAMDRIAANRLQRQRDVARIVDDFKKLPQAQRDAANSYMHDSTMSGKWGFDPHWIKQNNPKFEGEIKVDEGMRERFNALHHDTQAVVTAAFRSSHEQLRDMRAAVQAKAATAFDDDEKRKAFMDRFDKLTHLNDYGPYLPLKRFGNWVVIAKSPEFQAAEAELKAAKAANDKTPAGRARLKLANATYSGLERNPDHYYVSFRETSGEANELRNELAGDFGDNVDIANRDDGYAEGFASGVQTLGLVARMRVLSDNAETAAAAKSSLAKLLTDFELSMMSETSVRQSERRRKGIYGADTDMMRSFGTKGMSAANFISALESGGSAEKALANMKEAANAFGTSRDGLDRTKRTQYFNEISKRHYMGFDYKPSPVAEGIMRASSIFQLMFNPAYHLINALQPLTVSAPWLAGKHGAVRTAAHMYRAYRELAPSVAKIAKAIERNDYSGLPEDVQQVVRDLVARGAISADQIYEHGRSQWKTDDPKHPVPNAVAKVNRVMDNVGSTVEMTNRVVTAMAAYRLAKQDGLAHSAAADSAYKAIYETHGDYSGFNAPRFMRNPVARVFTQYRKFQFMQLGMWGRLVRDSLGKLDTKERSVARAQLTYSLGMMFVVGGFMGLPGAALISKLVNAILGDEDDPDDFEMNVREAIGDPTVADLLLKGVPMALLGVDISKRATAGDILTPLPYAEFPHDRTTAEKAILAALGPFVGGLLPKAVDGVSQFWQGNHVKGLEMLMPNGFGNVVKAGRLYTQGMTMKNGDLVMSADEISAYEAAMQAVGLPTTDITNRSTVQQAKYKSDQYYKDRVTQIKREYSNAAKDNDTEAMAEARAQWQVMNTAKKEHGYKPSALSDLLKAPAEQRKREKSAIAGVIPGGKRDAGALRRLEELTE